MMEYCIQYKDFYPKTWRPIGIYDLRRLAKPKAAAIRRTGLPTYWLFALEWSVIGTSQGWKVFVLLSGQHGLLEDHEPCYVSPEPLPLEAAEELIRQLEALACRDCLADWIDRSL